MEKKGIIAILVVLVFLSVAGIIIYSKYQEKIRPSTDTMELTEYYEVAEDEMLLFLNGRMREERLPYLEEQVYLTLEFVQSLNNRFYWDESLDCLLFTTAEEIRYIQLDKKSYTTETGIYSEADETLGTTEEISSKYTILRVIDGKKYIALDFVKDYLDLSFTIYKEPNRIIMRSKWGDYLYAEVTADTQLRAKGGIKAEVLREIKAGTKVELTDSNGTNRSGFLIVTTEDGVRAYIDEKCISESYYETFTSPFKEPQYSHISMDSDVNLVWDITISQEGNKGIKNRLKNVTGINVVSPTWFNISDTDGNISDRASLEYVDTIHELGMQVWGLAANFDPGKGKVEYDEYALFSNRDKRAALIKNLIKAAKDYSLDGINIDFEELNVATGPHYVQFLRELSIACRAAGIILSIDNYPPYSYNAFYGIEEQGRIADYVIIMAYDEHTSAQAPGSVASLTYVKEAINNTLAKVDKERVVIAIPFYTRIWSETQQKDGIYRTKKDVSMVEAAKYVKTNSMVANWLSDEGQYFYYAEFTGTTTRIWMEDLTSVQAKCIAISEAEVAGIAAWRLGQEDNGVWEIISSFFK